MTLLPITQPGNPLLRRPALGITDFGLELQGLIDSMIVTLLAANGLGLAAPQVAHSLRLILARVFQHEIDHLDGILYIDIAASVWRPADKEEGVGADITEAP